MKRVTKKFRFPVFLTLFAIWLIAVTIFICWFYGKANAYIQHYEDVYQSSQPNLVSDEIFAHFEAYDVDYIYENLDEMPRIGKFESDAEVKQYIHNMIDGKKMTYQPSSKYNDATPCYVVEADGFVVAEFSLCKDLANPKEFGFPTWQLKTISYYTEPFETVYISAPSNFHVYVNDVLLDDTYVCSEEVKPSDENYLLDYGTMPGIHDFYVADFYIKPEVRITDMFDKEVPVSYDEATGIYSTGYTGTHPDIQYIRDFGVNYTSTFANVISRDERLSNLAPYFPEGSVLYDSISRNTALQYFTAHSSSTIKNREIKEIIVYSEDVVYMEVYIEQHMNMGGTIQVVPTTGRLYCVRLDGEWKVISMRF
mgnify:CR=1 FL=1